MAKTVSLPATQARFSTPLENEAFIARLRRLVRRQAAAGFKICIVQMGVSADLPRPMLARPGSIPTSSWLDGNEARHRRTRWNS